MLRKQKKVTKKVVNEDKILTTYLQTQTWLENNKKRLSSIGGAAIVVILAIFFYVNNVRNNNERAATDLSKIFSLYDNGQFQLAINGVPERNIPGLQTIVDNYGSTSSGNLAKFYLANAYFNLFEYDKALEFFDDYSGGDKLLDISAVAGVAASYEGKKVYDKAAEYFEKAASQGSDLPSASENYFNAARNFARSGNKERALELYSKIKKDYSTTPVVRDIERFIAEAKAI